jgi:hypothetical protein
MSTSLVLPEMLLTAWLVFVWLLVEPVVAGSSRALSSSSRSGLKA